MSDRIAAGSFDLRLGEATQSASARATPLTDPYASEACYLTISSECWRRDEICEPHRSDESWEEEEAEG
jgi:hypothetical protein